MKLKTSLLVSLSFLLFLASCTKNDSGTGGTDPIAAKTILNVSYGTDPLQKMDIYLPANRTVTATRAIILIHGGGWTQGDKHRFHLMVDTLKNAFRIMPSLISTTAWPPGLPIFSLRRNWM